MHLMLRVESSAQGSVVPTTLHWHSYDPYAVIVTMGTGKHVAEWEIALDLLTDSLGNLGESVGLGDARFRLDGSGRLWLSLSSPDGFIVLSGDGAAVRRFAEAVQHQNTDPDGVLAAHLDWFLQELREIQP